MPRSPLYSSELINRIVRHVNDQIEDSRRVARKGTGFTMLELSKRTGINYHVLRNVFRRKKGDPYLKKPPWAMIDTVLFALEMDILDFLEPKELAEGFNRLNPQQRQHFRNRAKVAPTYEELREGQPPKGTKSHKPQISLDSDPERDYSEL
jgi:hypothetical protein